MRVTAGGLFRPQGKARWYGLSTFTATPGTTWHGTGTAFKSRPVACTLLARWEPAQREPWLLITDLPPETSTAAWYSLRAWIKQGCKLTKRGGWQWQRTRMTYPARAARLWLAVAVATLWLVRVGGASEDAIPESTILDVTAVRAAPRHQRRTTRLRLVSVFQRGWTTILGPLLRQTPLPTGQLIPEPWPGRGPGGRSARQRVKLARARPADR